MIYTYTMNNKALFIVGFAVLGGAYFFSQSQNTKSTPTTPSTTITQPEISGATQSRYVTYSKSAFDAARGKKRVYYFHAPWCPTCVPTDKEFQANSQKIPEDIVLFKTDYDSSVDLKKQYTITYQHTFVLVDENGKEIRKWNGGAIDELVTNTEQN